LSGDLPGFLEVVVHHGTATAAQIGPLLHPAGGDPRNVRDLGAAEAERVAGCSSTFVTFALLNLLPGDVSLELLGSDATPSAIARVRSELRLDDPLVVRYMRWLGQALQGDLGRSFITGEPVMAALARSLPVSIELMALSLLLSLAVPAGLLAAYRAGQSIDKLLSALAALLLSAPSFMLGLVLMFFLALTLKWLPAVGYVPLSEGIHHDDHSFVRITTVVQAGCRRLKSTIPKND
jgi:ABC-type dipeptide/oligopeptide/nickel transport system permease component